jgi:predicted phosphodiesterase
MGASCPRLELAIKLLAMRLGKTAAWSFLGSVSLLFCARWLWLSFEHANGLMVHPYVQPGRRAVVENGLDSSLIVWVGRSRAANFAVDYGVSPAYGRTATPAWAELPAESGCKYAATLVDLPLDARVFYRLRLGRHTVETNSFAARKSPTNSVHFVAVGDTVHAREDEKRIAWQIWQQRPDFFMHLGNLVYFKGTLHEYSERYWPCYNDPEHCGPEQGAPLMGTIPFYVVLGNHDVHYGLDLGKTPDGLAAFYYFDSPHNGPRRLRRGIPVMGSAEQVAAFRSRAGEAFPGLCFYSFENGPAHFLCLDGNAYTDFTEPALQDWVERDLASARTPWKFVFCHQPAFQTAVKEYNMQTLRLLSPILERGGVDVVFSGHTHNYQRTRPLRFQPHGTNDPAHRFRVNGRFQIDEHFDGVQQVVAEGIIHVVSGGGGARLFDRALHEHPILEQPDDANWVPYTARLIADRHSFSDVTVTPTVFTLRQIDDAGDEVDRFEIRKGVPAARLQAASAPLRSAALD